jgi:hypothetical protein
VYETLLTCASCVGPAVFGGGPVSLWSVVQFVEGDFRQGLEARLDGQWSCVLSGRGSRSGLVEAIMVTICLFRAAGYAAAPTVDALPSVVELTRGGCFPHFVAVGPFHCVYVHNFSLRGHFPSSRREKSAPQYRTLLGFVEAAP